MKQSLSKQKFSYFSLNLQADKWFFLCFSFLLHIHSKGTEECVGEEFDICIVKLHTVHLSKEGCSHTQCRCFFSNCFHNAFYSKRNQKNHLISTFYNTLLLQRKLKYHKQGNLTRWPGGGSHQLWRYRNLILESGINKLINCLLDLTFNH